MASPSGWSAARRVRSVTCGSVRAPSAAEDMEADVTRLPEVQRIVVRVMRDEVTLSADAAGALLHLRGYRQAVAKAPLRETLAAALLLASGWESRHFAARSDVRIGDHPDRGGDDVATHGAGTGAAILSRGVAGVRRGVRGSA